MNGTAMQMRMHFVIYSAFDIVVVPFPFTDTNASKRRPALVLSDFHLFGDIIQHSILAMITTKDHSSWPMDIKITELKSTGLEKPCIVRMKLFTLDNQLILRKMGHLHEDDQMHVSKALKKVFPF